MFGHHPLCSYWSRSVAQKIPFSVSENGCLNSVVLGLYCLHQLQWQRTEHFDSLLVILQHGKFALFHCFEFGGDFSAPPFQRIICHITSHHKCSFLHPVSHPKLVDIVPVSQKGHGKRSQHFLSRNLWAIKGFNIPQYKFSSHTSTHMILAKMNPGDWTFLPKRTCDHFSSLLQIVKKILHRSLLSFENSCTGAFFVLLHIFNLLRRKYIFYRKKNNFTTRLITTFRAKFKECKWLLFGTLFKQC